MGNYCCSDEKLQNDSSIQNTMKQHTKEARAIRTNLNSSRIPEQSYSQTDGEPSQAVAQRVEAIPDLPKLAANTLDKIKVERRSLQ